MIICFLNGHVTEYVEKYDSNWCYTCDRWVESSCKVLFPDTACDFCEQRPERWEQV